MRSQTETWDKYDLRTFDMSMVCTAGAGDCCRSDMSTPTARMGLFGDPVSGGARSHAASSSVSSSSTVSEPVA